MKWLMLAMVLMAIILVVTGCVGAASDSLCVATTPYYMSQEELEATRPLTSLRQWIATTNATFERLC
jgi:hypothetical protein